jgi:hypothetical protein
MQESVRLIDDVADASARFSAKEKQSIDRLSDHRQFQSSVWPPRKGRIGLGRKLPAGQADFR